MLEIAKKLSKNIKHVRVDLYLINDKIYFGELTFYHESGQAKFEPEQWNEKIGNWIDIKNRR